MWVCDVCAGDPCLRVEIREAEETHPDLPAQRAWLMTNRAWYGGWPRIREAILR